MPPVPSKFNYWKLWNFALDGLTSFSTVPLRVWTYVGAGVTVGALFYILVILLQTLILGRSVPGYASLMIVVLLLGSVQLISLGIIGEYLGRLYIESKQRPIYLVRERVGFDSGTVTELKRPTKAAVAQS
uniref:CAZy families GT2 protein n=1 Tax=uncultured Aeromonas sp. TaxID=263763 RepID=A0A060C401_9GAMM|nr:CAZy families GT2 protein [uncultured Aeromonas sp.]